MSAHRGEADVPRKVPTKSLHLAHIGVFATSRTSPCMAENRAL